VVFFGFSFSCLVGVRARTLHKQEKLNQRKPTGTGLHDDSGSKLRDKEQQRLSSK